MKKFTFPLQKVLEYDTHIQKSETDMLNALQAEYMQLNEKREGMLFQYEQAKHQYQESCEEGQNVRKCAAIGTYIMDQRQQILKITTQMREQMKRIDMQRDRLIAITKDKEIIEKLKTHSHESYLVAERKSDELFIEEFVSNMAVQGKR